MNIRLDIRPEIKHSKRVWRWALVAALTTIIFGWVYYFEPLRVGANSDYWNDKIVDVILLAAALFTAVLGARLTRHFQASEPPRRIWLVFTLGWWAWVGGELLGFVYDYYYWFGEYPEFTLIDICWLAGYLFFGLSLYYQFRLIYLRKFGRKTTLYLAFIVFALLLALGLTFLARAAGLGADVSWWALYLAILYPVFDFAVGAAALWLFFLFGRGYLGRPWWGLIAFAFADAVNIFFWMGGYAWLSDRAYRIWDLLSNLSYLGGYALTALAFLAIHEHLEGGITASAPDPA